MQNPTKASIPMETTVTNNGSKWNRKVNVRTLPFDQTEEELELVSPPPQDEDIPARKRPRLEEPFPTTTDKLLEKLLHLTLQKGLIFLPLIMQIR
jgi:hypothetical protein